MDTAFSGFWGFPGFWKKGDCGLLKKKELDGMRFWL